jgi:thioredoxin reductase
MSAGMSVDVAVLGGGPAGLAAACEARAAGASALVIEREERLGGILKQCVHDGFGVLRFKERLSGPEYALREIARAASAGAQSLLEAYVTKTERIADGRFALDCVSREGIRRVEAKALVLATGCRERTDRQAFIHGDRPAGIFTAGLAQYLVNVQGLLPGRKAVILGSGDIGLIMARRLLLEGLEVEGVYEIKGEPSGLTRNVHQCLEDFGIALHLRSTVSEVHGRRRVEGVTIARTDERQRIVPGSERELRCDTLVLSVGLIPENELALSLGVPLDAATKGPKLDQNMHTLADGIFACGNAVHVSDLADYVSESGEIAGRAAAAFALGARRERVLVPLKAGPGLLYAVPQFVDAASATPTVAFFRSNASLLDGARVAVRGSSRGAILSRGYLALRPPEMERLALPEMDYAGEASIFVELDK